MPKEWHDRHAASMIEDPEKRKLYRDIVADKKPYFMRYIYPTLMRQYNTYIKNTNKNALREFQMTVDELLILPYGELTERQHEFLRYYKLKLPVGVGNCVMNRICVRFEEEFDHQPSALSSDVPFDYSVMKSGAQYSNRQAAEIRRLCESYNKKLQNYAIISQYEKPDDDDVSASLSCMKEEFLRECENVCQNRFVLCDIILDICYRKNSSKRFAWDICADTIIDNLLANNGMSISAPVYDPDGDIQFRGRRYSILTKKMEEEYEDCSERKRVG